MVTIRIPASTSNLGPGFDCLGVALRIYNTVTVERGGAKPSAGVFSAAARLFFEEARVKPFNFRASVSDNIPRSRGLGSSATVRAGILLALNHLAGEPLDRLTLFHLCARLEQHPDNAAPAIFGGFTVVRGDSVQRFNVSQSLSFVLLVPELQIRTSAARKILPARIERNAAVQSCGDACAITAALISRHYESLKGAFGDHLHQPFRRKLIPFLRRVIIAAEKAGALGAFLSGSGSAIAALTLGSPRRIAAAMLAAAPRRSRILITKADNQGARILKIRTPKSKIQNR